MSYSAEKVKKWRKATKEKIVYIMGGGCCICSYKRCNEALAMHHLDPTQKDFGFGDIRKNPKSWDKIKKELQKCILVCNNCHSEIHAGIIDDSNISTTYDESREEKWNNTHIKKTYDSCICGEDKPIYKKYCSWDCYIKHRPYNKINWDNIDLIEILEGLNGNFVHAGEKLGCSDNAVRKRFIKITSSKNWKEYKNNAQK